MHSHAGAFVGTFDVKSASYSSWSSIDAPWLVAEGLGIHKSDKPCDPRNGRCNAAEGNRNDANRPVLLAITAIVTAVLFLAVGSEKVESGHLVPLLMQLEKMLFSSLQTHVVASPKCRVIGSVWRFTNSTVSTRKGES